jgi:hypothetical protein
MCNQPFDLFAGLPTYGITNVTPGPITMRIDGVQQCVDHDKAQQRRFIEDLERKMNWMPIHVLEQARAALDAYIKEFTTPPDAGGE